MVGFVPVKRWHKKKQPKGSLSINWSLPITQGLELAIIGPDKYKPDISHDRAVNTVTGSLGVNDTEYGEGLDFNAETTKSVSYSNTLFGKPFTCVIGYKLNAVPTAAVRNICGNYIHNTSGFRIGAYSTGYTAQFGRAGAAQILTGSVPVIGNKIDAVVANDTHFSYYENGSLSVTAAQAGFVTPTNLFALGGASSAKMTVAFCYLFSRALSSDEIRQLYDAPYHVLLPSTELIRLSDVSEFADLIASGSSTSFFFTESPNSDYVIGSVGPVASFAVTESEEVSIGETFLGATGTSTVSFVTSVEAKADLSSESISTVNFFSDGAGSIESDLAASGAATASFVSTANANSDLSSAGTGAASFVTNLGQSASFSVSGSTDVLFNSDFTALSNGEAILVSRGIGRFTARTPEKTRLPRLQIDPYYPMNEDYKQLRTRLYDTYRQIAIQCNKIAEEIDKLNGN